ncbi:MAG: SprT-like domain-containing protein [Nitrospira sp.]|nr:SprT-like domain-containing protein [Nitrospira sp.]MCP9473897.1 SprT-like domain-containing protein [Nitrospira sp.]
MDVRPPSLSDSFSRNILQQEWARLNHRYFAGLLPPISIVWSRRLTSSVGLFAGRGGPRTRLPGLVFSRREIRLSLPLFERLAVRTPYMEQELINTLAHEMIHQWQFDVLKRRPNHGPDFLRKMTEMNRSGEVAVTIYHSLQPEVLSLARFAWRCRTCGRIYRRQRNTINPRLHHCGLCRGTLDELRDEDIARPSPIGSNGKPVSRPSDKPAGQLTLEFPSSGS